MDVELFSQWLASLSLPDRVHALARIYSTLTVCTRELFLPDLPTGKDEAINKMLHGVNELHHTLSNWLVHYTSDESKAFPLDTLGQQLVWIADQYRIGGLLNSAVEYVRTGAFPTGWVPSLAGLVVPYRI